MKYMGSKARFTKEILPIILKDRTDNQWYIEPFGDKKLEMFARIVPEGWDVWGNEVESSVVL